MPVQPGGREGAATSGTDGAIFASVPLWEQDRKGGHRPASDPAMDAGEAGGLGEPVDAAYETQPADVGLQTGYPPRRAAPAGAIIAGAAALAIIAAVGWYASQPRERGVPELTPGGPDGAPVALAVVAPPETSLPGPAPATGEAAKPAPAARRATPPAQTPAPRVRPAPSAGEAGANASATTPPTIAAPNSPATDPMTVNPLPTAPVAPTAPTAPAAPPAPTPDPTTTP